MTRFAFFVGFLLVAIEVSAQESLKTETLEGSGVWIDPRIKKTPQDRRFHVSIWFERQFLGDGAAYLRRAREFDTIGRTEMRTKVVAALKLASEESQNAAKQAIEELESSGEISEPRFFWIVNGFACITDRVGVRKIRDEVPGVRKIFLTGRSELRLKLPANNPKSPLPTDTAPPPFDPTAHKTLWYTKALKADRVWTELGITGRGTLNVIHDGNFVHSDWTVPNMFRNPSETLNGIDDDGNGFVDDIHGYDFDRQSYELTRRLPTNKDSRGALGGILHGHQCAGIICGRATKGHPVQPGLAPDSTWAGVLVERKIEAAVEWAVEHRADTYSMSFSRESLGESRSHWRKMIEHGSFCGIHFVSGAGNFALEGSPKYAPVPVQMRIPEDIPHAVFAAAGVKRDLSRSLFSSQGPVEWNTEHYRDGRVNKPEVCAFNSEIPSLAPEGNRSGESVNGNSFAGPMFCGTIALMLSANPELKPWETREIIIETATDVGKPGFDFQTGHGLINAYEAVKTALANR